VRQTLNLFSQNILRNEGVVANFTAAAAAAAAVANPTDE
jgi:hypothetical protein